MIIVNGFQSLTISTKRSILNVTEILDPPLHKNIKAFRSSYQFNPFHTSGRFLYPLKIPEVF